MVKHFYIGVDGGASKCTVRVEDAAGQLVGQATSGPANIRLSVIQAWQSIDQALQQILSPLSLSLSDPHCQFHAGMGLAGCEVPATYQAFLQQPHLFQTLKVVVDAHTACLGAHRGADGAVIIAGTGTVGFQMHNQQIKKVSGWGFPHDDQGGGAWLGLAAIRATLQWLDGRGTASTLTKAIYAYFNQDLNELVSWANSANSTLFATLAPLVVQHGQTGDACAVAIMQEAALALNQIGQALTLPIALVGSIAPFLEPYLETSLRQRLRACQLPPEAGAILLVRSF
ncbi:MAG TPA: BadF/BadG/BcrA/BcrD ATPase family protein [Gammaproteobacteria bacterium]|nr:BadF/BadG/BcrA/BcrD ATPase family protein [Gammaproteobacteria bacterium]